MGNITDYLKQILSARYGKDVRQSIHDSIAEINNIATGARDSATASASAASASATSAANSASNAATSEVNAKASEDAAKQAAQTAQEVTDITYASNERAGLVKPKDVYVNQEDGSMEFTARTDTGILENSHSGGIRIHSITAGEDEQESTTGAQLFDASTVTQGYFVAWSTGVVHSTTNANGSVSDYIEVGDVLAVRMYADSTLASHGLAFYDENKAYVNGKRFSDAFGTSDTWVENNLTSIIPEGAKYVRFSIPYEQRNEIMVVATVSVGKYEKFTGGKPSPAPGEAVVTSTNQLKLDGTSQTLNGVTSSPDTGNQIAYLYGEATADATFTIGTAKLDVGTYYASIGGNPQGGTGAVYTVNIKDVNSAILVTESLTTDDTMGQTVEFAFTLTEAGTVTYEIVVPAGENLDNELSPMIATTSGAVQDTYKVEYTEGYPQEIKGTKGKNLVNMPDVGEATLNGVTWSSKNGAVTAKGTSTGLSSSLAGGIGYELPIIAGDYIVSGNANAITVYARIVSADGGIAYASDGTFSLDGTETSCKVYCQINNSGVTVNETAYPMIRPASILDPTYVPYGRLRIVGVGSQLIPYPFNDTTKTTAGVTITDNGDGSLTLNGTSTSNIYFTLFKDKTPISEPCFLSGDGADYMLYAYGTDGVQYVDKGAGVYLPNGFRTVTLFINSGKTFNNVLVKPMINYGTEALPWRPYTEQSIILSEPINFHGINGVGDAFTMKDGVFGVERYFVKETIDSSYNMKAIWSAQNTENSLYCDITPKVPILAGTTKTLCNRFTRNANIWNVLDINGYHIQSGGAYRFRITDVLDEISVDAFKDWLDKFETYVIVRLAVPTFEALPTADQIALHSLMSYDGVTHLYTDTEIPMVIDCEYGTSKVGAVALGAENTAARAEIRAIAAEKENAELRNLVNNMTTALVAGSEG